MNDLRDVNASLRKLVPPTVAALAAPSTVGISTLGTVSGLFSSGLLLKGADSRARRYPASPQRDRWIRWR